MPSRPATVHPVLAGEGDRDGGGGVLAAGAAPVLEAWFPPWELTQPDAAATTDAASTASRSLLSTCQYPTARLNRAPQSRTQSISSGGVTTWKSAPTMPSPMIGHSSASAVIRARQRVALISETEAHRPIRSRTASAGASTMTSMS